MSPEKIAFYVSLGLVLVSSLLLIYRKLPKRLKHDRFNSRWKDIQKLCSDKTSWKKAITEADDLLDKALKKKKIKGLTMGERMVSAQNIFSNNDLVWFGHKLRTKLDANPNTKVSQNDAKNALMGIGQALKDIGALKK